MEEQKFFLVNESDCYVQVVKTFGKNIIEVYRPESGRNYRVVDTGNGIRIIDYHARRVQVIPYWLFCDIARYHKIFESIGNKIDDEKIYKCSETI